MASIHGPDSQRAARARDRALTRLRRARQLVVVIVAAASLGFTVLAARAFPGHHATTHGQAVASLDPPKWTHRPVQRHTHRRQHRHVAAAAAAAPVAPAAPAASPPPQPSAPPPAAAPPTPPPPAPVVPAPVPTPQPPVVSSGGS